MSFLEIDDWRGLPKAVLTYLRGLPKWERGFAVLWLLMPAFLLIERSPPDIALTLIGFAFLARCAVHRDWGWTRQIWVRLCGALFVVGIISALAGPATDYTLGQAIVWIRFPLFLAASQVWLGRDGIMRDAMICGLTLSVVAMCGILFAELLITGGLLGRLQWPYGDPISGSFIAKAGLIILCAGVALTIRSAWRVALPSAMLVGLMLIMIVNTGDRMNTIIVVSAFATAMLFSLQPNRKSLLRAGVVSVLMVGLVSGLLLSREDLQQRMIRYLAIQLQMNPEETYYRAFRTGLNMALTRPMLGYGPGAVRVVCDDLPPVESSFIELPGENVCSHHPHNYYIQLAAESGVVGLGLLFALALAFIYDGLRMRGRAETLPAYMGFIVPLALFFPLQTTGSFYGQWHNIFLWYALSVSLFSWQAWRDVK